MSTTLREGFGTVRAKLALLLRRRIGSQREDGDFDRIVRYKVIQIWSISTFGLITMFTISLFTWLEYSPTHGYDAYYNDPDVPSKVLDSMYVAQALITLSTVVTIVLISQKYNLLLLSKRAEWSGTSIFEIEGFQSVSVQDTSQRDYYMQSFNFWKSRLAIYWVVEVVVHTFQPLIWMASVNNIPTSPPSSAGTPNLTYKMFEILMFLRLYLVIQMIHVVSPAYRHRFEVVAHDADLRSIAFEMDIAVTMKMTFYKHLQVSFQLASVLAFVVFGFIVFLLERIEGVPSLLSTQPIQPIDAMWFAYVTLRTIGYGEFTPKTVLGRIAACLCAVFGIGTLVIFSALLVSKIQLTKEQKQAVEYLSTSRADQALREAAAILLQVSWRRYCVRKVRAEKVAMVPSLTGAKKDSNLHMSNAGKLIVDLDPGHKADRLYFAMKKFRTVRKELFGAFTQAQDAVVNLKIDAILELIRALSREAKEHCVEFEALEQLLLNEFIAMQHDVNHFRQLGHMPV
jgi:hypothetical protein